MKKLKYLQYIPSIFIALFMLLIFAIPVFAIATPDDIYISHVWVYRNCIETGDQLYIIDFTVDYTSNPDESIGEAFIIRLLDESDDELGSDTPYAYYDDGYDRGVASIYFSADDAPAWEGAYSVELVGNPTLSWVPTQPDEVLASFNWMGYSTVNSTQEYLSGRILWLAEQLDITWDASYTLLENTTEGNYLSENGVAYFSAVIDNLGVIAPYCLSYRDVDLDYDRTDDVLYDYSQDYAGDLEDAIIGTPFDVTDGATVLGLSRGVLTALLYYSVVFIGMIKLYPRLNSNKGLVAIMIPITIAGAFIGVPLLVTIVVAFIALLMTGYALFYKNTAT